MKLSKHTLPKRHNFTHLSPHFLPQLRGAVVKSSDANFQIFACPFLAKHRITNASHSRGYSHVQTAAAFIATSVLFREKSTANILVRRNPPKGRLFHAKKQDAKKIEGRIHFSYGYRPQRARTKIVANSNWSEGKNAGVKSCASQSFPSWSYAAESVPRPTSQL